MYPTYGRILIPETKEIVGLGWLLPIPDLRDYSPNHPKIAEFAKKPNVAALREAPVYDDTLQTTNTKSNRTTTGALLIRNSWGNWVGQCRGTGGCRTTTS